MLFATRLATPLVLAVFALALLSETRYLQALPSPSIDSALAEQATQALEERQAPRRTIERVVSAGETLGRAFAELGLPAEDSYRATLELSRFVDPRRVRPGDRYRAVVSRDGRVEEFSYAVAGKGEAQLKRRDGGWVASFRGYERTVQIRRVSATLRNSLEATLRDAGADPAVGYRMADVLQWDLDFNRDLQPGDQFETLYEEVYLEGRFHALGDVLAMRYRNGGKTLEAYRYNDAGYYDQEGRPLRKAFLKSPLPYSRVTSGFSKRRFHPVLRSYRPHWGVDFGAPVGTPVRVTGNGVVQAAGWDGGGGKTVKVRHPGGYVTNYLHLSRFASGVHGGARVSQGDVIGYVGQTGLATGPHLDYRVQKNGAWINPTSLGGVQAEPIPGADLARFRAERDELRVRLAGGSPEPAAATTVLASAPPAGPAGPSSGRLTAAR